MGILSIEEEHGKRASGLNEIYQRTYVRSWIVYTTDPYVGPIAVRAACPVGIGYHYENGVPTLDPRHEFDNGAFVQGIDIEEVEDQICWRITANYGPWNPIAFDPDKLLWPIRVTFAGEKTERVVIFDKFGVPIKNSAGQRFEEPVTIDDHVTTLLITRNELVHDFDIALASNFSDTINDATWNTIPTHQAKMGIISTSEEKWDSTSLRWYYTVTYPVSIDRKPWRKDLLDQGYSQFFGTSSQLISIKGPDGQPVTDAKALNGSGHELPPTGTPVVLSYEVYDEADWSVLGIDLSVRLGV